MRPAIVLPLLFALLSAVAAAPILTAGPSLTEDTWADTIAKGSWFVELYSPYCHHCKDFAPHWKKLVDSRTASASLKNFNFAQVDCVASGDLCVQLGVKYYPSLFLYVDGRLYDEYEGGRTFEKVGEYVDEILRGQIIDEDAEGATALGEEDDGLTGEPTVDENVEIRNGREKAAEDMRKAWEVNEVYEAEKSETLGAGDVELEMGEAVYSREKLLVGLDTKEGPKQREGKASDMVEAEIEVEQRFVQGLSREEDDEDEMGVKGQMEFADEKVSNSRPVKVADVDDVDSTTTSATTSSVDDPSRNPLPLAVIKSKGKVIPPKPVAVTGPVLVKQVNPEQKRMERDEAARSEEVPKPNGEVLVLESMAIKDVRAGRGHPAFVKFYAPWCGHCKALAPVWKTLASELAGHVQLYEMDCDKSENKKACSIERVKGYPTLVFYTDGHRLEYTGKRDIASMKTFALKAAASSKILSVANEYELKHAAEADDVIFLFLHPSDSPPADLKLVNEASRSLIGGAPFYTSSSPDLFVLFNLPSTPTILVFKDHSLIPQSTFTVPPADSASNHARLVATFTWLKSSKLPTLSELSAINYKDIMVEDGKPPYVLVAVLSPKLLGGSGMENVKSQLVSLARSWNDRRRERKSVGRELVFAWVDGDKWSSWAKGMYQVKVGSGNGATLVVADSVSLDYWKLDVEGQPIALTGGDSLFLLMEEGIYLGKVRPQSSHNRIVRFSRGLLSSAMAFKTVAFEHPLFGLVMISLAFFGGYSAFKSLTSQADYRDGAKSE